MADLNKTKAQLTSYNISNSLLLIALEKTIKISYYNEEYIKNCQTNKQNEFFLRVFRTKYPLTEPFLSVILWSKHVNEQQTRKTRQKL